MIAWREEIVAALGFGESHAQPAMGILLCVSLGIAVQTPLTLSYANTRFLDGVDPAAFSIAFFAAVAVVANVVSWMRRSSYDALNRPWWGALWSVLCALACASVPLVSWSGMANTLVMGTLGALCGTAFTFVMLFLGHLFTRTYIPDILKRSFVGCALAIGTVALVTTRLPFPLEYLICAALNLLNAPALVVLLHNAPAIGDYTPFKSFNDRKKEADLFFAKVALPLFCAGIIARLFQTHNEYVTATLGAADLSHDVSLVVYLVVEFCILYFIIYGVRRFGWPFAQLHSFMVPLVGLFGTICVGTALGSNSPYDGGTLAIFAFFLALTWSFAGGASVEYLLRSASVFGMSLGFFALGVLAGDALNLLNLHGTSLGSILGALVCLVMAIGFLPPRPAPNLSRSKSYTPLRSDVKPEEEDPAQLPEEETVDDAPASSAELAPGGSTRPATKGRFMRRCDVVAQTFLLSSRETEVLYLLAKGRSMNHIMEELVISEGTAKTHINHVYKKLNVHSRHELVDLIESIEVETIEL